MVGGSRLVSRISTAVLFPYTRNCTPYYLMLFTRKVYSVYGDHIAGDNHAKETLNGPSSDARSLKQFEVQGNDQNDFFLVFKFEKIC